MFKSTHTWCAAALSILAVFLPHGNALPTAEALSSPSISLPLPVNILHTFDFPFWAENLAVQANGRLLVSRLDTPQVVQIDPTGVLPPTTIGSFNKTIYKGCLGISETTASVFYVITSAIVDETFVKTSGVNSIWKIDMNTFALSSTGVVTKNATISKLTDIPGADFLNGMTTLDSTHILVGDIYNGWVYKISTKTGAYEIVIDDPNMKHTAFANLGVNGLKIKSPWLYWTNTAVGSLNRILINAQGEPCGDSEVLSTNIPRADDFIIKADGTVFIAQNQMDELSVLEKGEGIATVVAGSNISTTLAGVTAGKFGRTAKDYNRLYLTTSGALALPINRTVVVAGSIVWIDTTAY